MPLGRHSRCHISSTFLLTSSIAGGVCSCVSVGNIRVWGVLSVKTVRGTLRRLFTCHLLRLPCVHLIWFHFCWPGGEPKTQLKIYLTEKGWDKFETEKTLETLLKLTSTTTTSTFTFGGKSSSGWKHLTMATSRWIVASRSLLWMTDRQTKGEQTENRDDRNLHSNLGIRKTRISTSRGLTQNCISKYISAKSFTWHSCIQIQNRTFVPSLLKSPPWLTLNAPFDLATVL